MWGPCWGISWRQRSRTSRVSLRDWTRVQHLSRRKSGDNLIVDFISLLDDFTSFCHGTEHMKASLLFSFSHLGYSRSDRINMGHDATPLVLLKRTWWEAYNRVLWKRKNIQRSIQENCFWLSILLWKMQFLHLWLGGYFYEWGERGHRWLVGTVTTVLLLLEIMFLQCEVHSTLESCRYHFLPAYVEKSAPIRSNCGLFCRRLVTISIWRCKALWFPIASFPRRSYHSPLPDFPISPSVLFLVGLSHSRYLVCHSVTCVH